MFAGGLLEEVQAILGRGYPGSAKPFESHGYRQAIQFLNGELNLKQAVFYAQRNTRRYAKRQMTWFRQESGIEWFQGFGDQPEIQRAVIERARGFLS